MSPGERERVVRDLLPRDWWSGGDESQGRSPGAALPDRFRLAVADIVGRAYDAGASRLAEVEAENERLRGALLSIVNHPHNAYDHGRTVASPTDLQYSTGVTDGHRCAAEHARAALSEVKP